jgi:hypothetical protein
MTPDTIKTRSAPPKVPPLEREDETWLRGLAATYARPFAGRVNIPRLIADARRLAARIERSDLGDISSAAKKRREAELDRGANVLEQLDALRDQILRDRAIALEALSPEIRGEVVHHTPAILAIVDRAPAAAGMEEASTWMAKITIEILRVLATCVRLERTLQEIEELRRRAFHSLELIVARSFGVRIEHEGTMSHGDDPS